LQRRSIVPRRNWQKTVESLGLIWHTSGGKPYWNESAFYRFTAKQIDQIEAATAELYRITIQAAQHVIDKNLFSNFGIPEFIVPLIEETWNDEPPALNHGRFDLGYDGVNPPKLFEYNCDTPTAMLEAAVVQWDWKESAFPRADQFNSLHDKLLAKWKDIAPYLKSRAIHFTHVDDTAGEDTITISYLRDLAEQAGLTSTGILTKDIGWNSSTRHFVDLDNRPIDVLFHLYPWEWLVNEKFGRHIVESAASMDWIEPVWKMVLSNKAILTVLWELFPNHANLLPCYFERAGSDYVRKPRLGREGANIAVVRDGRIVAETGGGYGAEGYVYQAPFELPNFDGHRPVLGSWIVDGEPAGMGIREDDRITGNMARFVPHVFE
jgi:glutathionylspermidine synthase